MGSSTSTCVSFICIFVFVLVGSASCGLHNQVCPFNHEFHFGDGFFDIGNAAQADPSLPVNNWPYGTTTPGYPNGRWSDGLVDNDYGGTASGFPTATPSLSACASSKAVIFAWASSPVLDHSFFKQRGVKLTSYAMPLSDQFAQFRKHLTSICSTPKACQAIMADSICIFGDVEANDIGIPLSQGKSIEEVRDYVASVTQASINATRELIRMGVTRIIHPASAPIGCFPYLLTEFANRGEEYDEYGCLKRVNDVIKYKNGQLRRAVEDLQKSYPRRHIIFANYYDTLIEVINGSLNGPYKENTLKACCGTGGKYNYDSEKFCGTSSLVSVCDDPQNYLHWDGKHLTQNANLQLNKIVERGPATGLNCTRPGPPKFAVI